MCRIALYASSGAGSGFEKLVECFVRGSLEDFMLKGFARGRGAHVHGWGYAYVYGSPNGMGIGFYRTSEPISYERVGHLAIPKPFDWAIAVLHSRLASDGPINVFNSHPHHFRGSGASLWLAHNGFVDKYAIAYELGAEEKEVERYSDSYFLTQWIGRSVRGAHRDGFKDAVREAVKRGFVISSLNLVAVVVDEFEERVMGVAVNYVSEDYAHAFEYYRLYTVSFGVNELAITSSTVALYLSNAHGLRVEPLDNGVIVFVYPLSNGVKVDVERLL